MAHCRVINIRFLANARRQCVRYRKGRSHRKQNRHGRVAAEWGAIGFHFDYADTAFRDLPKLYVKLPTPTASKPLQRYVRDIHNWPSLPELETHHVRHIAARD